MRRIKFKRIRGLMSTIDRISMLRAETLDYENFITINDVPKKYDHLYVRGVGLIDSEFYEKQPYVYATSGTVDELRLVRCIEIVVSARNGAFIIDEYKPENIECLFDAAKRFDDKE